ncbi:site-specific DNA-methyltransferase [Clostridium sp.]|uniref:site-specific DNA-methyltransferase n=1 Tax=Clostridium sp. TaxID=1506 RepID=UPI003216832F
MANLSQQKRERMLKFLEKIKESNKDELAVIAINEIENELITKKYGLVWEHHEERVDIEVQTKIPVFKEVKEKEIVANTESNDFNFLLEGDNLHSLKLLEKTHRGKVDVIYIDPPYNTGSKDFKYNDTFVKKEDAFKHSMWLSAISERLSIARKLLQEDGLIFISIDEKECFQLKVLCDEIFGEDNFIASLVWQKKKGGSNDSKYVATEHEYILLYTRNKNKLSNIFLPHDESYLKRYKEEDSVSRFYWDTFKRKSGKQYYPITCPDGTVLQYEENGDPISWLRSEARFRSDLEIGDTRIIKINDKWTVHFKQREPEGKKPRTILQDVGTTSTGSEELKKMFGKGNIFQNPKPTSLIKFLLNFKANKNITVLDFYAGTGTTAQAVLELNKTDGGHRHFILCTNNEENICEEITNMRVRKIILGYDFQGKKEDVLFERKLTIKDLSQIEFILENISNMTNDNKDRYTKIEQTLLDGVIKVVGQNDYNGKVEGIPANLKYYRTGFVDKTLEDGSSVSSVLQQYIKELVQLEHGVSLDGENYILLLSDEDADELEKRPEQLEKCKGLYISTSVLLTSPQEKLFKDIEIKYVPDYYFENELREVGEVW